MAVERFLGTRAQRAFVFVSELSLFITRELIDKLGQSSFVRACCCIARPIPLTVHQRGLDRVECGCSGVRFGATVPCLQTTY